MYLSPPPHAVIIASNFPSISTIFSAAFLYPASSSNRPTYANSNGYFSCAKPPLPLAPITAKLNMISAPVRWGPQINLPPSGEVASCDSRNVKWVVNWGSRKPV